MINTFKKYIAELDAVYQASAKTSILDNANGEAVKMTSTGAFEVAKMTMDGLGDYSRSDGYSDGDVSVIYEEKKPDYDRGRAFTVDNMDNEETAGLAFGKLSAEFIRTKVVPELDAYRFAKYATKAGTSATASLSTGADVIGALSTAIVTMEEAEVDPAGIYLFITPTLRQAIADMDSYKSKAVLDRFAGVVDVPSARFNTAITLKDGRSEGETGGGFTTSGSAINFMLISKGAVLQLTKHTVNKVISPEENQLSDGWKFCYRVYGLVDTYDNKTKGIYLHKAS